MVMTLPTSTTNITGLRSWTRGSSLRKDAQMAGTTMSLVKSLRRGRRRSWAWGRTGEPVQVEVEQEDVDPCLPEEAHRAALGVVVDQAEDLLEGTPRTWATRFACRRAFAREICGSMPEAEVVIMSTGRSRARSPGL